jgi:hypothetical protein
MKRPPLVSNREGVESEATGISRFLVATALVACMAMQISISNACTSFAGTVLEEVVFRRGFGGLRVSIFDLLVLLGCPFDGGENAGFVPISTIWFGAVFALPILPRIRTRLGRDPLATVWGN